MSRIPGEIPVGDYCKHYQIKNDHAEIIARCPYFIQTERLCLKHSKTVAIYAKKFGDKDKSFKYIKLEECTGGVNDV